MRRHARVHVIVYSRQDCHLCDVVLEMARGLQAELPFVIESVDIDRDRDLVARYGTRIPVVTVNQREIGVQPVTVQDLRRAIKRARWSGPVSRILSWLGLHPNQG